MKLDAVVVGAGPNGLSAAITLAQAGLSVRVLEAHGQVGGGLSSAELTLPGFVHDVGSAIHPLGYASPDMKEWPLHAFGLDWIHPPAPFVHSLDGRALVMHRDLRQMALSLGADGEVWQALFGPLVADWEGLLEDILKPLPRLPKHPVTMARFGLRALPPAPLTAQLFKTEEARALWAGLTAHVNLPPSLPGVAAGNMMLGTVAHAVGWPFPRGGAQALADAMAAYLRFLGGEIETGVRVRTQRDLPAARVTLVDSSPGVLLGILGDRVTPGYRWWTERMTYGTGLLKLDYALSGPIPWSDPAMRESATVHLGSTLESIVAAETEAASGQLPAKPYLLAAQNSLFDPTRAPAGQHTFWAYSHVPSGTPHSYADVMESRIEQAAPGFRDLILERRVTDAQQFQAFSPVFQHGDVNGGAFSLWGLLARPTPTATPYRTPDAGTYLCSSSTPPGGVFTACAV
ncbi:phytoene desaturase family protein [Deinococcus lacus]|uniref:Phytoene desaturase family protein n=1 Tax=Deinococcus lacus TaxID=392561 RepID=A0ABW1YB41_9DEIO